MLQSLMVERGVDLAVIGPSANLRYILGYRAQALERLTTLVVCPDSAVMILPDFDADEFVAATGFDAVAPWTDRRGPTPAVSDAFARLGKVPSQPQSVIDDELPFLFYRHLRDRLGAQPGLASELLGALRVVKSPVEQENIARTGELVSVGVDIAQAEAAPGVTEFELKRKIEEAMWDGGAESVDFVLVQAGPNSASPHHSADHTRLRDGEPVLIDIAICLDGYFADITQQVFLGEPLAEYAETYEVVRAAQEAGVSAARPGATAGDVAEAASAVIAEAGYSKWNVGRTGHGLGLEVHEAPSVVEGNQVELRPGMVITVEPGIYMPGRYGIRIEDTVLITDGEPRCLTRGARPLYSR
jgi:Xaa-Pro aminopeptidase